LESVRSDDMPEDDMPEDDMPEDDMPEGELRRVFAGVKDDLASSRRGAAREPSSRRCLERPTRTPAPSRGASSTCIASCMIA